MQRELFLIRLQDRMQELRSHHYEPSILCSPSLIKFYHGNPREDSKIYTFSTASTTELAGFFRAQRSKNPVQ